MAGRTYPPHAGPDVDHLRPARRGCAASYLVIAATTNAIVATGALAAYLCYAVVWNIAAASLTQRLIPDSLRGRVGSVSRLLGLSGPTAGALLGGMLAASLGLAAPFWIAGGLLAATAAAFLPIMLRWDRANDD